MATITVDVFDTLYLFDFGAIHGRVVNLHVTDFLAFAQSDGDNANRHELAAADVLEISDFADASGDWNRAVTDTLVFSQTVYRPRSGYAYQNLVIAQSSGIGPGVSGWQTLAFREAVTAVPTKAAGDVLVFVETLAVRHLFARPASDTLVFDQSVTVYIPSASWVGVVLPTLSPAATVTLTSAGVAGVTLPAPDFGNTEELGQTRIARNARGGTFIIARPTMWPTTDEFGLTFTYLSYAQAEALRAFVNATVGRLCTYLDHEGKNWSVVVTNPEMAVTQPRRSNYSASLKLLVAI